MTAYRADFERISRNHEVPPLNVGGAHEGQALAQLIAEQVYAYAKPKVASRDVEVVVDLETLSGTIFCGMTVGGSFKLTEVPS